MIASVLYARVKLKIDSACLPLPFCAKELRETQRTHVCALILNAGMYGVRGKKVFEDVKQAVYKRKEMTGE